MIDFSDVTFIIPVRIESNDRRFNFIRCIQHLCDNLKTNINVYENSADGISRTFDLMQEVDVKECRVYGGRDINAGGLFHRTAMLNKMLSMSETPITVNYDCDILLKPETYIEARRKILEDGCDMVFPYQLGDNAQVQINFPDKNDYKTDLITATQHHSPWGSMAGHAQFFKTESYKRGYGENENFIAYGPEDRERLDRFQKLGYKVEWTPGHQVFHMEHSRTQNSNAANPYFDANEALYYRLKNMSKEELVAYYESQEYLKKYKDIGKNNYSCDDDSYPFFNCGE